MVPLAGWHPRSPSSPSLSPPVFELSLPVPAQQQNLPQKTRVLEPLAFASFTPKLLERVDDKVCLCLVIPSRPCFPVASVSARAVTVPAKVTRPSAPAALVPVRPSACPPSPPLPHTPSRKRPPASPPAAAHTCPVWLTSPARLSHTHFQPPRVCLPRVAGTVFQASHCHSEVRACSASPAQAKGEKMTGSCQRRQEKHLTKFKVLSKNTKPGSEGTSSTC